MPVLRIRVNGEHLDFTKEAKPEHDLHRPQKYHIPTGRNRLFEINYGPKHGPVKVFSEDEIEDYLRSR